MCGISGELRFDGAEPDLALMGQMLERLARRGPDHEGTWSDGPLLFGHRRLSVIDLSDRSNQPMIDPELGLALVFNGAIYNYRELRQDLLAKGYHFFSGGDTEVILKAYAEWGEQCVEHLIGMFAFAIWNLRERSLFLARDRLGIKPLYFSRSPRSFRFASNSQALLAAPDVDTAIDPVALHHQLTLHAVIPAPRTILQGIRKLAPATTTLTFDASGNERSRVYWKSASDASNRIPRRGRMDRGGSRRAATGGAAAARRRRRAGRRPVVRRAGFQPAGGAAGRNGRARSADILSRL
jgi:asparagine synthase (glutamine-hydrolysing)